ncbi:MAG: DUF3592 domain-containing protein [Candidatus Heimdallarchaeota archaeon]|nr:DUF3592 domain-containing protein [Candidatus Heimdallarchaeota archaeon]
MGFKKIGKSLSFEGVFLFLVALYLIGNSFLLSTNYNDTNYWPSTLGEITNTDINQYFKYRLTVDYEFEHQGEKYTNRYIFRNIDSKEDVDKLLNSIRAGDDKIEVFYNPENPNYSVLEKNSDSNNLQARENLFTAIFFFILFFIDVYLNKNPNSDNKEVNEEEIVKEEHISEE